MSGTGASVPVAGRALLVPVSVEALVVPGAPVRAVNLAPRFQFFQRFRLGGLLRARPWEPDEAIELGPGVHLHWKLPSVLTHGAQGAAGDVEFPPVPNRWLVLRVAADGSPRESTRAWVVQADALASDGTNPTVAKGADGAYVATRIGRADPYAGWENRPASSEPLTVVGPGHPMFAAFYPGCRNVFGFRDTLEGVDTGTFFYLVVGWYTRREDDPLGPDQGRASRMARRRDFEARWLGPAGIGEPRPTRTVCHGTLYGVTWRRGDNQLGVMPEGARYSIAVGNTAAEALAALVAAPAARGNLWEPLLSAFQYDVLANLDVRRGMPDLDAELHRRRFHAADGGVEWIVRPIAAATGAPPEPGTSPGAKPQFPTEPGIAAMFDTLVDTQRARDGLDRELLSLRAEYHAAWYRSELPRSPDRPRLAARLTALEEMIRSRAKALGARERGIRELCGRLQAKGVRVPSGAGAPPGQPEYELVATPMPWFWRASDPSILVAAPGDPSGHRYGGDRRAGSLASRVVEEVVSGLGIVLPGRHVAVTMPDWRLSLDPKAGSSMPLDEIAALYRESLLLDPARAEVLAASAYRTVGSSPAAGSPLVADLAAKIRAAQRDPRSAGNVHAVGTLPAQALTSWQPQWHPLFLVWEVEWAPTDDADAGLDVRRQWALHDNTEYRWTGGPLGAAKATHRYRGWAPLSLSVSRQIQDRLHAAPAELAGAFASWTFLTQSASGLNDALIMREDTLHVPPLRTDGTVDQDRLDLFGTAARWSPLAADVGFSPVRSGHARLTLLRLVDGFGQARTVLDTDDRDAAPRSVITAEAVTGVDGGSAPWIALPPRIVQPARLLARWVSVYDEARDRYRESNANPRTSPVVGWIVPNHLDQSLLVCDARGRLCGELQQGAAGPVWSAVPGSGDDRPAETALSDARHLKGFVEGLVHAGAGALEALLNLIDRISLCITTPQAQPVEASGHLVGQPLALARASLTLEAWGRLATDQRESDPALQHVGAIGSIQFPVRLGDVRKSADSLIGCFVRNDYTRMRPAFGAPAPETGHSYFALDGDLTVSLDAGRIDVTLLLDPRGSVHVACGILPAGCLELPGLLVTDALERMETSIRVGPVLGAEADFRVPVPDDVGGSWIWFDRDRARDQPWKGDADVSKPETGPGVPSRPLRIRDGWLSFKRAERKPQ